MPEFCKLDLYIYIFIYLFTILCYMFQARIEGAHYFLKFRVCAWGLVGQAPSFGIQLGRPKLAKGLDNTQMTHNSPQQAVSSTFLRTLGGTPNRDPCSLWGLIWGLPRDIGVI